MTASWCEADGVPCTVEEPTVADADELGRLQVEVWRQAYAGLMPPGYLAGLDPKAFAEKWAPEWQGC